MTLLPVVVAPLTAALVLASLPRTARRTAGWIAGLVALACAGWLLMHWSPIAAGDVLQERYAWLPAQGIHIALRADGFAWTFALLVSAIGALVVLYGAWYLDASEHVPRFFSLLMAFMTAMLGLVLAGDLVFMVLCWETTSLSSFLLIGWWGHRRDARQGARMALAITGLGGLALLGGVLLIGHVVGSYALDDVLAAGPKLRADPLYLPAMLLVVLGALTKSAQFPFHFWLPNAMAAPTPVSAYLHSATMVKAGVFLLARLWPVLAGTEAWFWVVAGAGLATLLVGAWLALFQQDLKGLLAYSTISHLGLITLLFGLNSELAAVAGVFHILNHATFKASLFMAAGIIDHETGSRDMRQLNGLFSAMPVTATLAMVAAAAMAGVPLLNGFLSKEMFFAETLYLEDRAALQWAVPVLATVAGAFSVAYSVRFVHDVFFNGEPVGLERTPHEPPRWMRLPVELLVAVCLLVGILPSLTVAPLLDVAARPVVGGTLPEYSVAIWHGLNLPLAMSAIALLGGVVLYFGLQRRVNLHTVARAPTPRGIVAKPLFDRALAALTVAAGWLTDRLETGRLQLTLAWLVALALVAAAWPMLAMPPGTLATEVRAFFGSLVNDFDPLVLVVWLLAVACAIATMRLHRQRLLVLMPLGGVGLAVALAFVRWSAPDLALTQLLVEMVSIVLVLLALRHLPADPPAEPRAAFGGLRFVLAALGGLAMAAGAWAAMRRPFPQSISPYYLETAVPLGGGSNAVNVVIVDYRGFDTFGEIAVLSMAALVVHALLQHFRPLAQPTARPAAAHDRSILLDTAASLLLPLAMVVAAHFFLRGHNLPGGGFIAGLVLAIALVVQQMARGIGWVEARRPPASQAWIGTGLLAAGLTGFGAWLPGFPFLTSAHGHPALPLIGEVPIASAMFFDLGVFLSVVGATVLALSAIGRIGASR